MIGIYVFLTILAVILLMLISPVRLKIEYKKTLRIKVGFLFIRLNFSAGSFQKKQNKKQVMEKIRPAKPKEKKNKFYLNAKDILEEKGTLGLIFYIIDILQIVLEKSNDVLKHAQVKRFRLHIRLSGGDAAATAIEYGVLCTVLYPFLGAAAGIIKFREYDVVIQPDYENGNNEIEFYTLLTLRPIFALAGVISFLYAFLSLAKSSKQIKGGAVK